MEAHFILSRARTEAFKVLRACAGPIGLKASAGPDGYTQVWARDSMISLIGASISKDATILTVFKKTLETLRKHQTELGCIPNYIDPESEKPNFKAYMDGNMWYVLGQAVYWETTKDRKFLETSWPSIHLALEWLAHQDVRQAGLISMQEACDWQDLFAVRDQGLTINVLYAAALSAAEQLAKELGKHEPAEQYAHRARITKREIRSLMWVDYRSIKAQTLLRENYDQLLLRGRTLSTLAQAPYFIPYLAFQDFGTWFDTLGNALAIIFGVADKHQSASILDYASSVGIADPAPAKAIYPPIRPGHKDWRDYYFNRVLNLPHHYHNGGIWPFIGGFWVLALVKAGRIAEAETALLWLAQANQKGASGEWEFNEWLHGQTGKPMGKPMQAWSAGMFLWADAALRDKGLCYDILQ